MNTNDIAAKLVHTLVQTCSGIQHDYDVKEIQQKFDYVLKTASKTMENEKVSMTF